MSGDAQPRKRKNKGKKKGDPVDLKAELVKEKLVVRKTSLPEEGDSEIFAPLKNSTDEVIHVHKDIGCGGNVVTKLIFFGLLAVIGVVVGVILLEHRGSSDEDSVSTVDSPWSVTLGDWIDQDSDSHHADDKLIEEDDHDEIIEHDDHGQEEEDDDHSEHGVEEGGEGILGWISLGGGGGESTEEGFSFGAILGSISFGGSADDTAKDEGGEVEVEEGGGGGWFGFGGSSEPNDEDSVAGGWFGFGGGEEEVSDIVEDDEQSGVANEEEEEEEGEESEEIENDGDEEEEREDSEQIENENDEEEEEEEEDEDGPYNQQEEEEDDEDALESGEVGHKYSIDDELSEEQEVEKDISEPEPEEEVIEDHDKSEENEKWKDNQEDEGFGDDASKENDNEEEEDMNEEDKYDEREGKEEAENTSDEIPNEEELFPEAREALRKEREELKKQAMLREEKVEEEKEADVEKDEGIVDSGNETEEEGVEETEGMALKFGVGVALVVVAHVVLVKKWNSWAGDNGGDLVIEGSPISEEMITRAGVDQSESQSPDAAQHSPPPPAEPLYAPPPQAPVLGEDSPVEEEEEEAEVDDDAEVEDESEVEIDQEKFKELIAKYGQETTPESSDIEQSDDEGGKAEYSGGDESGGAEESPAEVVSEDDQEQSEDEMNEWTGIKKSDIEKIVKLGSETETDEEVEDEEEEESEDEPPPPPVQPSGKRGGARDTEEIYPNDFMTNDEDWAIREELDRADEEFNYEKARTIYEALLKMHPNSPRARYGFARAIDRQAEDKKSNRLLEMCINAYFHALTAPDVPEILYIQIASRLINRLRFRGLHVKAVEIHKNLIDRFNNTPEYRTDLGITYLMINNLEEARIVLKEVLKLWPEDHTALAHYGLVLKLQGNIHGCIKYLEKGLSSDFTTTKDSRLFFHLGDALSRVGRESDAIKVYDKGVAYGLFRSRYQRSLYNIDRLTARPWWTHEQTTYSSFFKLLEDNWIQIRDEGQRALKLNGLYRDEAENLRDKGDWKQFELFARGSEVKNNCKVTPFTCSLIRSFEPAATCKRGQSKFSVMEGNTHVWAHCGPTNCRLRAHLGLIIPDGPRIRVANVTRIWEEGKVLIFDDSFEHEVWHDGSTLRLVLIVDVWHPELMKEEKLSLSPI